MKILNLPHSNGVKDILDLVENCHNDQDIPVVLEKLVDRLATLMETDVASLYLLDPQARDLVLVATHGLNQASVGKVRMPIGEGLVGKTFEWQKPVSLARGSQSRKFKYFPETGEEKYSSFLSVPLIDKRKPIGVIVVQNAKATRFSTRSAGLLMALAAPALKIIEKIKLVNTMGQFDEKREAEAKGTDKKNPAPSIQIIARRRQGLMHRGIGAAPGIAIARVRVLKRKPLPRGFVPEDEGIIDPHLEKKKVLEAFRWVEEEIRDVQSKAEKRFGIEEAAIFEAYRMILENDPLKDQVIQEIEKGHNALKSVETVINRFTEELTRAEDEYIRERAYDIRDMGRKITDHLLYGNEPPQGHPLSFPEPCILLSDFWSISDFVELDLEKTRGIISPSGGASSHIAILAESLNIPAVLGLTSFADIIHDGDLIVMDGTSGVVIINPDDQTLEVYEHESRLDDEAQAAFKKSAAKKVAAIGGKRIVIGVNLGMVAHVRVGLESGAEEIGLYRTEFPFLIRRNLPTEEEQYQLYRRVVELMHGKPVTIRTLDIGGDKYLPYLNLPQEMNPFLGWRSIRIFLDREDLFRIQLRAIFRASAHGKVRLLFPMVSAVEEIRKVKVILKDVRRELKEEGTRFQSDMPIGIMVEVPSAVELANHFAREVNFFSIGTNDLTQYILAVDRNNPRVAPLYNSAHPAVLRAIQRTVEAAHRYNKPVSVCGEMAAQPLSVALLIGLGVDSLSMSSPFVSRIKTLIPKLDLKDLKKLAKRCVEMPTVMDVIAECHAFFKKNNLEEFVPHERVLPTVTEPY